MADSQSGLSDATVFVSLALMGVWMYRQKVKSLSGSPSRWGAFFGALTGKYTIVSNVSSGGSSSSSGSSSSTATSDPNSALNLGGAAASIGGGASVVPTLPTP